MFRTWQDFYQSDLQSVYALWVAPAVFLLYWWLTARSRGPGGGSWSGGGAEPRATSFVNVYAPLFALESMIDPFVTGPLFRWLHVGGRLATYDMVPFVLLGDFRAYLLIFFLIAPQHGLRRAIIRAAAWTLIVPIFAWSVTTVLESIAGELPAQTIWIVYELAFFAVTVFLALRLLPSSLDASRADVRRYLQAIVRYVAAYYALWAAADLLLVSSDLDFPWAIRVIPNQLYYSFWIPFAYFTFFSPRYAATSKPTQASR